MLPTYNQTSNEMKNFNTVTMSSFSYKRKYDDFIQNDTDVSVQLQRGDTSHVSSDDEDIVIQNKSFTRELPKWMLGTSKSSSSSLSSHRTDSVNSTTSVDTKVKYVTISYLSQVCFVTIVMNLNLFYTVLKSILLKCYVENYLVVLF